MKAEILSAVCGIALVSVMYAFTRVTLCAEKYDTQYIAEYEDGHLETVCTGTLPPVLLAVLLYMVSAGGKW